MAAAVRLESDLLRTFLAVAESRSFTLAADTVGRTQSAVSMQMKKLEEVVGTRLFVRGPRGVTLTPQGSGLVRDARRIVAMLDETAASLKAPPLDGPVRIGLPEEYGGPLLTCALRTFTARHPLVEVTIRYGRSAENLARVRDGGLDLAVVFEWPNDRGGEVMMTDPTVWVTSDIHRQHERSPVPIAMYTSSGWCRESAMAALESSNILYRLAYASETSGGLHLAVSSGLAVAPISRSCIPRDCRELTEAQGYRLIDDLRVVLHRNPQAAGEAVESMAAAIRDAFRTVRL